MGGNVMDKKNKLGEVDLAKVTDNELKEIQKLEQQLGGKYYIIAFEK